MAEQAHHEVTVTPGTIITARLGIREWYKLIALVVTCVIVPIASGAVVLTNFDNRARQNERDIARESAINSQQTELLQRLTETVVRLEERSRGSR
ncbi:MAG: hypothetical protein KIS87_08820 [Phycisphaeraceae bacterium]|nr:hypothetical protein [Phycisphaeraceae bacterium]